MILFLLFSSGLKSWAVNTENIITDFSEGKLRVLENRMTSYKAKIEILKPFIQNCNGVMSLEYLFLGAYSEMPIENIYDVWEIPPFGDLDHSHYRGLNSKRVDCLLISKTLSTETGKGTNFQIRYDNYIKPYADRLMQYGAKQFIIEGYGEIIKLEKAS